MGHGPAPVVPDKAARTVCRGIDLALESHQELVREMCFDIHPELLIVDSLVAASSRGESSLESARELLGFLGSVASAFEAAVLVIHHLRKAAGGGRPAGQAGGGRPAGVIAYQRRGAVGAGAEPGDSAERGAGREWPAAAGGGQDEPVRLPAAAVRVPGGRVAGYAIPRLRYERILDRPVSEGARDQCAYWLREYLNEHGPSRPAEVLAAAREAGFSRNTVYRSRKMLDAQITDTARHPNDPQKRWRLVNGEL